jgi:uncharacterized cupin superfamily protein
MGAPRLDGAEPECRSAGEQTPPGDRAPLGASHLHQYKAAIPWLLQHVRCVSIGVIVNVFTTRLEYDDADPAGYRCGQAFVGREAGGVATNVKVYELPPGESLCPYHYEYEEEWLLILGGELVLRVPAGERPVQAGELVCFPAGPDGAHKLTNRTDGTARVLMFSSAREPAVAVYPDSDKIGVFPPVESDKLLVRRENGQEDYYAGEL